MNSLPSYFIPLISMVVGSLVTRVLTLSFDKTTAGKRLLILPDKNLHLVIPGTISFIVYVALIIGHVGTDQWPLRLGIQVALVLTGCIMALPFTYYRVELEHSGILIQYIWRNRSIAVPYTHIDEFAQLKGKRESYRLTYQSDSGKKIKLRMQYTQLEDATGIMNHFKAKQVETVVINLYTGERTGW